MPVDFNRVPPQAEVPRPPQVSLIAWAVLLIFIEGVGASLTFVFWPSGRSSDSLWFWLCALAYPIMTWAFLLCSSLARRHAHRNQIIADNQLSSQAEAACHEEASQPLAILGHAWCISADDSDNSIDAVLRGSDLPRMRPSAAVAEMDVDARWLELPQMKFYPGNELSESARHHEICAWLIERLIDRCTLQLNALKAQVKLEIELVHRTRLESETVEAFIRQAIAKRVPALDVTFMSSEDQSSSLFRTDAWFDHNGRDKAHLLISVVLLDAISTVLSGGVIEAGVALLVGPPRLVSPSSPSRTLRMHRPARGSFEAAAATIESAAYWGRSSQGAPRSSWTNGIAQNSLGEIRQAVPFLNDIQVNMLDAFVGDCSVAGPWMAIGLAAESALSTGSPQLVMCGDGNELSALVCRKQI
ncbi:hypothetical protein [Herbaspirillum huttiense]|uniref:hypothetical protein n=1 Tax=Herbaspirillum huttiense TaxID=863372 RepID=UPI000410CDD1|nr:hypothetical protein [Herbaspirillum huttiense]